MVALTTWDATLPTGDAPPGSPHLVVLGERGPRVFSLAGPARLTVGRSPEASVVLDDPRASRIHLEIVVGDAIVVRDLGSRNGTSLGGCPLPAETPTTLRVGDVLAIGATLLIVQTGEAPPATAAASAGQGVVLADPEMLRLARTVELVAPGEISVLLLGETGVGKEIFAEMVHRASRRAAKPLLRLHCAALPDNLLESELFGHEKGAFTGAAQGKPGLLETAEGGTVFLDEIGEVSPAVQVKLLRVLEERRVTRVGGLRSRALDIRIVAATHRDLNEAVASGRFRQDLYFRLAGISLTIPPLRARPGELDPLARHFLAEGARRAGRAVPPDISDEALARLRGHTWPGNLRELRNAMERAVLLAAGGPIEPEHLTGIGAAQLVAGEADNLRDEIAALERQRILDALARCAGNQTQAAQLLGMPRRTLINRLAAYGLPRPRKGSHA